MAEGEAIECVVARWYYRRLGLVILMLVGMGCYFLYDGKVGYLKDNQDLYDAFYGARNGDSWEVVVEKTRWAACETRDDPGMADVRAAYEAGKTEQEWRQFAVERSMSVDREDRHSQEERDEQLHWAYGMFVIAGGVIVVLLLNAPKKLRADGEAFITPKGVRVPYAGVVKVDKRKWDNKGLADVYFREGVGPQRKAVIDDLKFGGAGRILDRILKDFDGELIERAPELDEEEAADALEEEGSEGVDRGGDGDRDSRNPKDSTE